MATSKSKSVQRRLQLAAASRSAAWAIGDKIFRKGTQPTKFMERPFLEALPALARKVARAVGRAPRREGDPT